MWKAIVKLASPFFHCLCMENIWLMESYVSVLAFFSLYVNTYHLLIPLRQYQLTKCKVSYIFTAHAYLIFIPSDGSVIIANLSIPFYLLKFTGVP